MKNTTILGLIELILIDRGQRKSYYQLAEWKSEEGYNGRWKAMPLTVLFGTIADAEDYINQMNQWREDHHELRGLVGFNTEEVLLDLDTAKAQEAKRLALA